MRLFKTMLRRAIPITLVALLLCSWYVPGQSQPVTADITVNQKLMPDALTQIALTYKVVIGLERSLNSTYDKAFSVELHDASLKQTLDFVAKANPSYSWRRDKSGVFRVYTVDAPTLPQTVVKRFNISSKTLGETVNALEATPEVLKWLKDSGCVISGPVLMGNVLGTPGISPVPNQELRISVSSENKTLAENLDEIAVKSGSYFWEVGQWGGNHIVITFQGPQLHRP